MRVLVRVVSRIIGTNYIELLLRDAKAEFINVVLMI